MMCSRLLHLLYWITAIILVAPLVFSGLNPSAPLSIDIVGNYTVPTGLGSMLNTSGGEISIISINATTQNLRWKGFVGNVSGTLALTSIESTLFSWDVTTVTGEIYATRNSSLLEWSEIKCANDSIISNEEHSLNMVSTDQDSISITFSEKNHHEFYAGTVQILEDSCYSIALNVNNTVQTEQFQETLLSDGTSLIYSSILENGAYGFDNSNYDFQMIVAENSIADTPSTPYYFYVELI
jgi:hypothetical protein